MQDLVIKNGRIIDPSQDLDTVGDLVVRRGRIESIQPVGEQDAANGDNGLLVIDARGCVVCPGFIDLHTHLREPGYEDKETIATGAQAAAAGGFTTVCCMPNTNPAIDNLATLQLVRQIADGAAVRVLPIGAITKKREGKELSEMGEMARNGAVGFSDDGRPVPNSRVMRYALEYGRMLEKPIIAHCEDLELVKGGVMNEGLVATKLGLAGMPSAAEDIGVSRDITIAEAVQARLHIAHVSTRGAVELIRRAKEKGVAVTAEVTPHHLTLTEEWVAGNRGDWGLEFPYLGVMAPYDANTKVNPPLRTNADIQALIEGLRDGTIDAIATDHAPHSVVDKKCEYDLAEFGISGLETALGILMTLVHRGQISLRLLVEKLTFGPAKVLGLPFGTLKSGSTADITVFDPDEIWTVDPERFFSKGKNTPLAGMSLRGKVICTVFSGRIAYLDEARCKLSEKLEVGEMLQMQ